MRENRPYGSEGGASQTNGTSLPPIVDKINLTGPVAINSRLENHGIYPLYLVRSSIHSPDLPLQTLRQDG
jgi:hypothetical protein